MNGRPITPKPTTRSSSPSGRGRLLLAVAAAWGVVVMPSSFVDGAGRHMGQLPQIGEPNSSSQFTFCRESSSKRLQNVDFDALTPEALQERRDTQLPSSLDYRCRRTQPPAQLLDRQTLRQREKYVRDIGDITPQQTRIDAPL
jgi:hypothetical protein